MAGSFVNFVKNVERLGQKKRGRRPVFNAHQFYPSAIEADLERATREEFLRALEENIQLALRGFTDDIDDLTKAPAELPPEFVKKVSSLADAVGVKNGWNFSEYAKMTVGQPYFPPPAKDEIFEAWKKNFQQLCISAESDAKADISRIATEAKMKGWNKRELEAAIRAKLPAETKHRAELIARTETAKLNSAASISTYKQLGIRYYVWLTTLDGRDRETHTHLNGLICSLDNPNVYY
jgi:SPP1 gp7 family putative phage head morphogenesis protein